MKRALFIFDDTVDCRAVKYQLGMFDQIDLLPLCGDWKIIDAIHQELRDRQPGQVFLLEGAKLLNQEIEVLREKLPGWSSWILEQKVGNRRLEEYFTTLEGGTSTYYFSLLSEKNPLKTDHFLRLAQAHVIHSLVENNHYSDLIASCNSRSLVEVIQTIAIKKKLILKLLGTTNSIFYHKDRRTHVIRRQNSVFGNMARSLGFFAHFCYWLFLAKFTLRNLKRATPSKNDLLFISYFPYIDTEAAKSGVFRNKYAIPLQEKLSDDHIRIIWLLMFIHTEGGNYRGALKQAREFVRKGESLYFLEEFFTLRDVGKVLLQWLRQILSYFALHKTLKNIDLHRGFSFEECHSILSEILMISFLGPPFMEGTLRYFTFQNALRSFSELSTILYYCEMQVWENALNIATKQSKRNIRTIGFQHTSVSPNHFFYFQQQPDRNGPRYGAFLPDVIAVNGQVPLKLLGRSDYRCLREVEAIRHMYLHDYLHSPQVLQKKEPILLVVGSIDRATTKGLVSLIVESFSKSPKIKIWLKGHPSCPIDEILASMGFPLEKGFYTVKEGSVESCLQEARWIVASSSTVSIEALAYGCQILVPFFGNSICLSPILGFKDFYQEVFSPQDLQEVVISSLRQEIHLNLQKKRDFVRDYWCLDPSLTRWMTLLRESVQENRS